MIKRQRIKEAYQCCISTIEATYQRCISARSLRSRFEMMRFYFPSFFLKGKSINESIGFNWFAIIFEIIL